MMTICLIMFNIGSVSLNNMELEGDREEKPFDTFHIFFFNSDLNAYIFHNRLISYCINNLITFSVQRQTFGCFLQCIDIFNFSESG